VNTRPARKRVQALSPEERRAALIEATIPLLVEYGATVTTRQIADAAGVAEGTIFGVFPDKASLLRAAILQAMSPEPAVRLLGGLSFIESLRDRLETAVEALAAGIAHRAPLIAAVRGLVGGSDDPVFTAQIMRGRDEIIEALTGLIEPDRALLRRSPAEVARQLIVFVFAMHGGAFVTDEPLTSKDVVSLLLDGVLIRKAGDSPC
jgi:AcrR family transcriptional regulator